MIKIYFIIIAIAFSCIDLNAERLTPLQEKAKREIFSALKKYGTNISYNGDKCITFKYKETNFDVNVNLLNQNTLYLCLSVIFGLPDEYNSEISNIAAFQAASGKPVCSFSTQGALAFSCEMYAKEAKPFIAVLPNMLDALTNSTANFQEEYEKAAKSYKPTPSLKEITIDNMDETEFIYPKVNLSGDSKLYIEKVKLNSNNTILDMVSYNGAQYQWCSISKNSYIRVNDKKYSLTKAEGIAYSPQHTNYPKYKSDKEVSLHFKLYFPPLPKGTTTFDFEEGTVDGWEIRGVKLKHGISMNVNGECLETAYHIWRCKSIEIQEGQTILTKTVKPKDKNTFIFSSQNEYIEDADTGRKYYLQNSSIGFEGLPQISYDTNQIIFYEVYPALPSTVKRINISSGTEDYVKGLQIR